MAAYSILVSHEGILIQTISLCKAKSIWERESPDIVTGTPTEKIRENGGSGISYASPHGEGQMSPVVERNSLTWAVLSKGCDWSPSSQSLCPCHDRIPSDGNWYSDFVPLLSLKGTEGQS